MGRKRKNNKIPKVHKELEGLDLSINAFGEIISNIDIDKVNAFLNKTVPDKKLINRSDDEYQQEFKIQEPEEIDEFESLVDPAPEEDIELPKKPKKK
jgi:hypothetical protein